MGKKQSKYAYITDFLHDSENVAYVYADLIQFYHYDSVDAYPSHGLLRTRGYARRELKKIGRHLTTKGFTAISPREVEVQSALGLLPSPSRRFNDNKLIRGYVRKI